MEQLISSLMRGEVLAGLILAIFLLNFFWNRALARQVANRTRELLRAKEELEQRIRERTAELVASNHALRFTQFAVDKSQDQAFWHKADGRVFYANESACRSLEYGRDEIIGLEIAEFDPIVSKEDISRNWAVIREKGSYTFESVHRARSGRTYPVEIRANYVVFDGEEFVCCSVNDISERKHAEEALRRTNDELEIRVRQRTRQLTSLAAELSLAEERERRRIAGELHDQVAQTLALGKIKLGSLLNTGQWGDSETTLREIVGHLGESIEEIRSLTFQLSPPLLHEMGLGAALEWLGEEFQERHGIRIRFTDNGSSGELGEETRGALFQMSRELLVNVVKHARADRAGIEVSGSKDAVRVRISDNGIGFDPAAVMGGDKPNNSFGLLHIHHRIRHLGGKLLLESGTSGGTVATLELPRGVAGM